MLRSRRFEEAVKRAWLDGKIPGEMHLGIGEEAIVAGVLAHLQEGDALALDHRCTPPLIMRGVDPLLIMKECMGRKDGLCGGMGGHMHLFSKPHLAGSTGIVGAGGPLCAGMALASQYRDDGSVALAFFGDGAFNQGMLMESFNLAAAWKLPAVFICKNNSWAIATKSSAVTGGDLLKLAAGFGMTAAAMDGSDVESCWTAAGDAINKAREGRGPVFLLAECPRMEGHFLGDPLLRWDVVKISVPLTGALFTQPGATMGERLHSMGTLLTALGSARVGDRAMRRDPLDAARGKLGRQEANAIEAEVEIEMKKVVEAALS
jgi:pyruvate dehydrogenase E1 component alpha subunit